MSLRGPLHFWFLFWTAPGFRIGFVALLVALAGWSLGSLVAAGMSLTGRRVVAVGGVLAAAGLMVLVAGLLLPDTEAILGPCTLRSRCSP
jgi:hypothetical protein